MKGRHRETEQLSVRPLYVLLYGLPMREELTAEGRPSSGDTGLGIAAVLKADRGHFPPMDNVSYEWLPK